MKIVRQDLRGMEERFAKLGIQSLPPDDPIYRGGLIVISQHRGSAPTPVPPSEQESTPDRSNDKSSKPESM
jgi:hypothetical protein